ncbi:MAG: hypothetical protein AB7T49_13355 [Oligoflexales bacterium]
MKVLLVLMSVLGLSAVSYANEREDRAIEVATQALVDAGIDASAAVDVKAFCLRTDDRCIASFTFSYEDVYCRNGSVEQVAVGKEVTLTDFTNAEIEDFKGIARCGGRGTRPAPNPGEPRPRPRG